MLARDLEDIPSIYPCLDKMCSEPDITLTPKSFKRRLLADLGSTFTLDFHLLWTRRPIRFDLI